jgi:putative membrane protein
MTHVPFAALLHVGGAPGPDELWHHWGDDPLALATLAAVAWLYARGLVAMRAGARARGRDPRAVPAWRSRCFFGGMLTVALALLSPLDALAEALLSAHMVQHLLLMIVAPPLLVLGMPGAPLLRGLPRGARRAIARWWLGAGPAAALRQLWRAFTVPLVALLLHVVATWTWHLPAPYQAALRSAPLHALEHLSFLGSAMCVWWAALRPRGASARRAGYATGLLLVFATALQGGALGALMTFARTPWYPDYGRGAAAWGMSMLEDQQLAGLVMWVPGGLLYVAAAGMLFAAWLEAGREREGERATRGGGGAVAVAARALVLVAFFTPLALAACTRASAEDGGSAVRGGDPERGRRAVATYGCGSCHAIPGIPNAHGEVGPPLAGIARRSYIAGQLPNSPENMVRWVLDPPGVEPGTAMPKLVADERTARDVAAYLYTLR